MWLGEAPGSRLARELLPAPGCWRGADSGRARRPVHRLSLKTRLSSLTPPPPRIWGSRRSRERGAGGARSKKRRGFLQLLFFSALEGDPVEQDGNRVRTWQLLAESLLSGTMTSSRCSHLPEVPPDCAGSAPSVKTVEDCGGLSGNGQPQPRYVMQVSAKDGQLLSTVVRTLATQSPFNERPMCRICHEGGGQEDLLSPCECTGTLGMIHRSCLERWLSSSNTSYCELCHFSFVVERKPRPLVEWLRNPGPQHEKRTLFGDIVCFLFITPLATISGWLCLRGAVDHLHFSSKLEAVGLIALTVALFTIYLFWTLVSFRYHCRLYNEWRRTNQRVILLTPKSASLPSTQQALLRPHSLKRNSKETIV
ncbi:E3 ubiquitin-protein ligase MARCH3 [Rhinatrema bivittatum]|uniref:E3 ubiquitin-protein ligase MARCH3 n=1 Tax=Rhinatrema bivittatum TaxID=194408 RepID=UPI00112E24D2|nr:E3 ubiquitin-protein ligase MARCH3 [Rhinatrema bivittatum]